MRVEVAVASRELFGADRSALRLARVLAGAGHEVRIVAPSSRPDRGLTALAGEAGVAVEAGPVTVASSRGFDGITGLLGRGRGPRAELEIYNSTAVAVRAGDSRPRALVVREWLDPRRARHRALCAVHRRRMDAVVAVSSEVAARWRACAGGGPPVRVIPNWIEDDWLGLEPPAEREGILFAGRLNAWKGHEVLANAFERAFAGAAESPSLTFLGAESCESPFGAAAVELERRCLAAGWRLESFAADPRPAFARAALVVVPSLHPEPFGNVVLEGLAAGARVVSFPGGGVRDLAPIFGDALEIIPRDPAALASALARWWLAGGEPQSEPQRAAARSTLRQRYSEGAVGPAWLELAERLVSGAAGSTRRSSTAT